MGVVLPQQIDADSVGEIGNCPCPHERDARRRRRDPAQRERFPHLTIVFPSLAGVKRRPDKQHFRQSTDAMYAIKAEHADSDKNGEGGWSPLDRLQASEHRTWFKAVGDKPAEAGEPTG